LPAFLVRERVAEPVLRIGEAAAIDGQIAAAYAPGEPELEAFEMAQRNGEDRI
jgi:hypothetical protein